MGRRGISEETVRRLLAAPEQIVGVRPRRVVAQSRDVDPVSQRSYLVRVFVDVDREPAEVVTVYRTSRIDKYWRNEP
jgi:hypothetical protein